jgi:hypothetical protein
MSDRETEGKQRIEGNRPSGGFHPVEGDPGGNQVPNPQRLRFHYNREDRLKKLGTRKSQTQTRKWGRLFGNKKGRRLLLLLANMALIYAVVYAYVKPSNVYVRQKAQGNYFELNVTALRGKKTIVGFTVRNGTAKTLVFNDPVPVALFIRGRSGTPITSRRYIERGTVLKPGDSTSVIFLFEEAELPRTAELEVFYADSRDPVFKRSVRF